MQPINESTDQLQGLPTFTPLRAPLKYCGSLDEYMRFDVTPVIGTEFRDLQLADILSEDRKLRDLAILGKLQIFTGAMWLTRILVSERGVIFFRTQKITIDQQKFLATKLGELSGKPTTSKVCSFIHVSCTELSIQLHKHILHNRNAGISVDGGGRFDDEVSVISSEVLSSCFLFLASCKLNRVQNMRKFRPEKFGPLRGLASEGWHSEYYQPSPFAELTLTPTSACLMRECHRTMRSSK